MVRIFSHRSAAMADARDSVGGKAFDSVATRVGSWPMRSLMVLLVKLLLVNGPLLFAAALVSAQPASAQAQALGSATIGPASTGIGSQFEMVFWQSVDSGSDPALYEAYLSKYPDGTFAQVARVKLEKLRGALAASSVVETPTPARAPVPAPSMENRSLVALATAGRVTSMQANPVQANPVRGRRSAPSAPGTGPNADLGTEPEAAAILTPASALRTASPVRTPPSARPGPAPFVTEAVPAEPASETENSAALRRLLGALGDSQRLALPGAAPVALPVVPPLAPVGPVPSPSTPEAAGLGTAMPTAVPNAAALSAGAGQGGDVQPIAVGPLPTGFALPPRPALGAVPGLTLPGSFCSAEARNTFHDGPYIAAVEAAKRNNDSAIAYMRQLQTLYDRNQLSGDINPMNALASEARAYGPIASAAFAAQSALVSAFQALMAVPIAACDAPK